MMRPFLFIVCFTISTHTAIAKSKLKSLREKLKDESTISHHDVTSAATISHSIEESPNANFHRPVIPVSNIILVHQDLVGASVPLQILKRYLIESEARIALKSEKQSQKLNIYLKRVTFKQIKSLSPISNPCWVTIVRQPQQRVLSLFHHASVAVLPHRQDKVFGKFHTDDDTASSTNKEFFPSFIQQQQDLLVKYPRFRYVPQWTSWADSFQEAIEVLVKNKVLIGLTERLDELLIMMKHRLGWTSLRSIIHFNLQAHLEKQYASSTISSSSVFLHSSNTVLFKITEEMKVLLDAQEYLQNDMRFYSGVKLLYLDQVRLFGMGRLETETNLYRKMMLKLSSRCEFKSQNKNKQSEQEDQSMLQFQDQLHHSKKQIEGFGQFGGFGEFGTNEYKKKKRKKMKIIDDRKVIRKNNIENMVFPNTVLDSSLNIIHSLYIHKTKLQQRQRSRRHLFAESENELIISQFSAILPTSKSWDFDSIIKPKAKPISNSESSSSLSSTTTTSSSSSETSSSSPFGESIFEDPFNQPGKLTPINFKDISSNKEKTSSFSSMKGKNDFIIKKELFNDQDQDKSEEKLIKNGFFQQKENRIMNKRYVGIHFPGPKKLKECETTRSGLITKCHHTSSTGDRSEMILQCMLHSFDLLYENTWN